MLPYALRAYVCFSPIFQLHRMEETPGWRSRSGQDRTLPEERSEHDGSNKGQLPVLARMRANALILRFANQWNGQREIGGNRSGGSSSSTSATVIPGQSSFLVSLADKEGKGQLAARPVTGIENSVHGTLPQVQHLGGNRWLAQRADAVLCKSTHLVATVTRLHAANDA